MFTVLVVVSVMAQAEVSPPPLFEPEPPPKPERQFSESFKKRRAWEAEQQRPSWKDAVAVGVGAYGAAELFSQRVVPAMGFDLELGGHLWPAFGLVGMAQVRAIFVQPGTEAIVWGVGGGVRLGARHFVTLGGGVAGLLVMGPPRNVTASYLPTLDVRGGIVLAGWLGVHLRAGVVFAPAGPMVNLGVGIGFSS